MMKTEWEDRLINRLTVPATSNAVLFSELLEADSRFCLPNAQAKAFSGRIIKYVLVGFVTVHQSEVAKDSKNPRKLNNGQKCFQAANFCNRPLEVQTTSLL